MHKFLFSEITYDDVSNFISDYNISLTPHPFSIPTHLSWTLPNQIRRSIEVTLITKTMDPTQPNRKNTRYDTHYEDKEQAKKYECSDSCKVCGVAEWGAKY